MRHPMLRSLAHQVGVALLAICLASAPVLGAMPRCCQTGAVKASGNCCCGAAASAEEPKSCCQQVERSCCAAAADADEADTSPAESEFSLHAGPAPCHCQALVQPPALAASKDQTKSGIDPVSLHMPEAVAAHTAQLAVVRALNLRQAAPPGISLQKIYCRWTV